VAFDDIFLTGIVAILPEDGHAEIEEKGHTRRVTLTATADSKRKPP